MSSDNDSDSCELFPKFSKKIKNSEDKFWSKFSLKMNDESLNNTSLEHNTLIESNDDQNLNSQEPEDINEPVITVLDEEEITPTTKNESPENVLTRINALLDNMQEKVTNALNQPVRGRGRKRKRQAPVRKSNRVPEISEPIILSDDDDKIDNEIEEIKIDLNPVIHIKVLWRNFDTHTFKLKKFQRLTPIKDYFVKTKNANPDLVFFTLDDKEVDLDVNCWASLRLPEYKKLEGCLLPDSCLNEPKQKIIDTNKYDFQVKVQTGGFRGKSFQVKCKKDDKIDVIYWQIIQETGKDIEEIKLSFDGELLKPDRELSELDVMDGDCFDLI